MFEACLKTTEPAPHSQEKSRMSPLFDLRPLNRNDSRVKVKRGSVRHSLTYRSKLQHFVTLFREQRCELISADRQLAAIYEDVSRTDYLPGLGLSNAWLRSQLTHSCVQLEGSFSFWRTPKSWSPVA